MLELFLIQKHMFLAQTKLNFLNLDVFALLANDRLGTAVALANALFKVLAGLNDGNSAGLLDFAVKAAE